MRSTTLIALLALAALPFFAGCREADSSSAMAQESPPAVRRSLPPISPARRTSTVIVAHDVLPSVVNIQTESRMRQRSLDPFFGFTDPRAYQTQSVGSGFVWASDGIVVTNAHVVEGASRITANFSNGQQLAATVIGVDPDSDVAVLRVESRNLTAAPIGTSSDLMIGESVVAVGNPFGLSGTVTTGVVSALGRSVPSKEEGRTFTDFIQTDASINPGNSGGPLLNIEGKVIGINTAIYAQAQGIGFAIPVDRARKIVEDLRKFGEVRSVWIGAVTTTLTPEEARRLGLSVARGAVVSRMFPGSPAAASGLEVGDVIVSVNGMAVDSREAFSTSNATLLAGKSLRLKVQRADRLREIAITPIDAPPDLGLRILRDISGITASSNRDGVLIKSVARGSRAERIGLEPGDLIIGVNGVEVTSTETLNHEIRRSVERPSIVISIPRGRYIYPVSFPMGM
ncbi:MAG TPA: trypsin-like peptidase domain-containing protein [Thermoanaerobaculia bacterium]|nr:trypsin-like peptidase domain-containing protein [Thermoanaerobaculia bacterium]